MNHFFKTYFVISQLCQKMKSVKTKIRNTCKKYCHVNLLYKQKKIISSLSNKDHLVILKQGKGRCVLIVGQNNYSEKCMSLLLLSSNQFVHIANGPTKSLESEVQQTCRKIKSKLPECTRDLSNRIPPR